MKTKIFFTVTALFLIIYAFGQNPTLELTFTAIDSAAYVQLDSIKVMDRTQGGDTVLYYPDTVLVLDYQVGISETNIDTEGFYVFQNYPNPVADQTTISLLVPEKDNMSMIITDMLGRVIINSDRLLGKGIHSFRFTPSGGNLYFFSAKWRGNSNSIKIVQIGSNSNGVSSLEYLGSEISSPQLKSTADVQSFFFNIGDTLLYIAYTDTHQSGMLDAPEENDTYTFQFATNIPCPGTPKVEYEGQVYNTIQILSQCWLKENLNVGTMIPGNQDMANDGLIEKYCYNNLEAKCDVWGGLYQWNEMMQYYTNPGIQGICPPGWHIPTDEEWKVLEGVVDSQYGIGDPEWDGWIMRGSDIGDKLKSQNGWYTSMNGSDSHGFALLPGGLRYYNDGNFHHSGAHANLWSSSEHTGDYKWFRFVIGYIIEIYRNSTPWEYGYSVRCIRN
jgi:uncharacterized protein (TIGR02145 family)